MINSIDWATPTGVRVAQLDAERDREQLMQLFDSCRDFQLLVEGSFHGAGPALQDLLYGLPLGRMQEDKAALGVFGQSGLLLGVCDLLRDYPGSGELWIGLLLLRPEWRGTGLGSELTHLILTWAKEQCFKNIGLGVVSQNEAGYRFWQRIGFREVCCQAGIVMGDLTNTVIRMRLELP